MPAGPQPPRAARTGGVVVVVRALPSRVDLRHCGAEAVEGASPFGEFEAERLLQSDAPGT
jgi:hypothetical protein